MRGKQNKVEASMKSLILIVVFILLALSFLGYSSPALAG